MASRKLTAKAYIEINGANKLWYEIDEFGEVTWHLPKDIPEKEKMLKNIGRDMSRYAAAHPESGLWSKTN